MSELNELSARTLVSPAALTQMLSKARTSSSTGSGPDAMVDGLRQDLQALQQHHTVLNISRLAEFLVAIWLTLKVALPGIQLMTFQPTVSWTAEKSLTDAINEAFASLRTHPSGANTQTPAFSGTLPAHFTIAYLTKNHGWTVSWSSNLLEHLQIDPHTKTVVIYEHKMALVNHLQDLDNPTRHCPLPRAVLEEALDTLHILFPPENSPTKTWLEDQNRPFHTLGSCGRSEKRDISNYAYWQTNLWQLAAELNKPRRGLRQLTVDADQRNLVDVVTFWTAAVVAVGLALGFGIASTYFSAKSYWVGQAQYDLALAQACSAEGANLSLPQYCS